MTSPIGNSATSRPSGTIQGALVKYDFLAGIAGAIGLAVFPEITAAQQSGDYLYLGVEQFLQEVETEAGPDGDYNLTRTRYDKTTFATRDHGVRERVRKRESAIIADHYDMRVNTARKLQRMLLVAHERRVAAKVFNASIYTGAALTTEVDVGWYDPANATIRADVVQAKDRVSDAIGAPANALVVSDKTFERMRLSEDITKTVHAQGAGGPVKPEDINEDMMARALGIERVIVGGNRRNSADEGQTLSVANVWNPDYAMVCRVARTNDPTEPCIGRTVHWKGNGSDIGGRVTEEEFERYIDMRVYHDVEELHLMVEAGHLMTGVSATS